MDTPRWYHRLLKIEPGVSLYQWIVDRISNNWEKLALLLAGGSGMTLAAIKDWVWNIGPLGWCLAFFAGAILTQTSMLLYETVASRSDRRRAIREIVARPNAVNVLASEFRDQRISVADFYNAFGLTNAQKLFTNFEMIGPSNIALLNCTMVGPILFRDCQFILIAPGRGIRNVTAFERCNFVNGKFVQCTFYVDAAVLSMLRQVPLLQGSIDVVTYEPEAATARA